MYYTKIYPIDFIAPIESVEFEINSLHGQPTSNSEYQIDTNLGVFQNRDSLLLGKLNSDDIKAYASQKYKEKSQGVCTAYVSGYRQKILHLMPNVISLKCHAISSD